MHASHPQGLQQHGPARPDCPQDKATGANGGANAQALSHAAQQSASGHTDSEAQAHLQGGGRMEEQWLSLGASRAMDSAVRGPLPNGAGDHRDTLQQISMMDDPLMTALGGR
jgi:hypothetical protein